MKFNFNCSYKLIPNKNLNDYDRFIVREFSISIYLQDVNKSKLADSEQLVLRALHGSQYS